MPKDKYEEKIKQLESDLISYRAAVEELKVLNEIAVAAGRTINVDQTLKLILNKTVSAVNAEHGSIRLVSEEHEVLKTFIKQENISKINKNPHIGEHITGWVLLNKKSLIIKELSKDERFKTTEDEKENIKSLICSPIWFEGKVIGIMQMINKKSHQEKLIPFTENDMTLLSIISVQAGQLIKNSELQLLTFEKEKEAELSKLETEKLHELDRIKTNFFTNLSHEFRTPLTLILGPLEKLMEENKNYSNEKLNLIYKNANRLLRLINELLDLSSIDAGKMELQLSKADVITFAKGIAASFKTIAEIKNLNLIFNCNLDELITFIDKNKLEKILCNLLINAIKFTGKGNIIISIPDEFKFKNNFRFFEITIEDTGAGISSDKMDDIFKRFFTEGSAFVNEVPTGTGIGLSLVKELAELHHGFISVKSILNKGTKFILELPLDKEFYIDKNLEISFRK